MDRSDFVECKGCEKVLMERFEVNRRYCLDCWIAEMVDKRIGKEMRRHLIQEHGYDD